MAKKEEESVQTSVTFIALQSPKQFFTFGGLQYSFIGGKFTANTPEMIAYLDANHATKRQE